MTFFRSVLIGALCAAFVVPAFAVSCTNTPGQKECNGSYYVCRNDAECVKGKLPSNATAGHCVSAGRNGYKVCTATACNDDYEVKSGHCQKKKAAASTPAVKTSGTSISGTVIDSETGEPVLYATIALMQSDGVTMVADDTSCVADDYGKFSASFNDIPQDAKMRVKAVGYEEQFVALGQNIEIKLKPSASGEPEVYGCSPEDLARLYAVDAEADKNGDCFATKCIDGYSLKDNVCVPDDEQESTDKTSDAEDAYQKAKDKEQSTANKMLGGLSMAATGIGGMQLAQGLAEKSADAAAESDMTAYLQTFQCKIGDKRFKGGEMGVGTGTGNELIELYQQYVDLAADLKERKAALGIKAGIESEVIMDKAKAGLYDDTGKGIENGTYASLYRASKGNEKDKDKLDDAKDTSANRVKYGGIAAGVGAVGGLIGDAIINGDDDEEENVTEADCKKAGGTFKDKKCTCKDKNKKYKNGKCVEKSNSDSGIDLSAIGASLGNNLGSGAAGLLQGAAGGDGGAAGLLQSASGLLGQ